MHSVSFATAAFIAPLATTKLFFPIPAPGPEDCNHYSSHEAFFITRGFPRGKGLLDEVQSPIGLEGVVFCDVTQSLLLYK